MKNKIIIDPERILIAPFTDVDCENKKLNPIKDYQNNRFITLEEAVEPLRKIIPHLNQYIQEAKRNFNINSSDSLTIDESAALYLYTMDSGDQILSRLFNQALRCKYQTDLKTYWFKYLELIYSALSKLSSVSGYVYQGIPTEIKENYSKNKIITWWGITSCTPIPDNIVVSLLGKNSTLLNILVLNGKDISAYSCNKNRNEIVILPGTRLHVNDVSYNNNLGINEIDLEEIADDVLELDPVEHETALCTSKDEPFSKYKI
ncbi:unnamed protein product [Rotaria sp. Silwood2]|nr:unnamed protein product [Rotaria sp. Silwood2]CAF4568013.1 unnamed protein product [Rotaria sp. Silwood2]